MVNPERQHNALAALDIFQNVIRADALTSEEWSRIERKKHMGYALTPDEQREWDAWEARMAKNARNDESEETRERHEGKLSKTTREEIGESGSDRREDMPESAFLEPASRKYPVKEKRDGEWKYTKNLLLAAARRARLEHDESLAAKADKIREREFGAGGTSRNDSSRHWRGSYVSKDGTTKTVTVMALDAAGAARVISNLRDFARAAGSPAQRNDAAPVTREGQIAAHVRYKGHIIDTSFTKGSNGTKADYFVVTRIPGQFSTLAEAKAAVDKAQ